MSAPTGNNFALDAWAAWHPVKGFADPYTFEGPVAFADLDSCVERVKILNAQLIEYSVHINRVPQHDEIDHQAKGAKLILLTLAIPLAQFAAPPMEYDAGKLVPTLAPIELDKDTAAIVFVVNEPQHVVVGQFEIFL